MPQIGVIVGIDVSKGKVDACIRPSGERLSTKSPEALVSWLQEYDVVAAVMEASGGYEQDWAKVLRQAGVVVRIVDPKRVRHFAKSAGRLAKSDPIDAEMIAWFGATFPDARNLEDDPEREELDHLVGGREGLKDLLVRIENWGEHERPRLVARMLAKLSRTVKAELKKIEAGIAAKIKANAAFAECAEILTSAPGLGDHTAAGLIAWMPELGHISNKEAAALIGVAPYDEDSGAHKGDRHIKGGRRALRTLMYMATLSASTQHNPVLKAYYQRLRAKGKPAKVALIACMRKLITILNVMLARGEKWNPAPA